MSDHEAFAAEHSELVQPLSMAPDAMPDPYIATCLLANNPAKLVTVLALKSFPPEQYVRRRDLSGRIYDMQEGADGWTPSTTDLLQFCWSSLRPAGLLEYQDQEAIPDVTKNSCRDNFRLNQAGRFLGTAIAGTYLQIEAKTLEAIEDKNNLRLPLRSAMGRSGYRDGRLSGAHTRLAILRALLPLYGGLPQNELVEATGLSHTGVKGAVKELSDAGLLNSEHFNDDKRVFELTEQLSEIDINSWQSGRSKSILEALVRFKAEGFEQISAKRILERAVALRADLSEQGLQSIFWDWMSDQRNARFVQEVRKIDNKKVRTYVSIADEYRAFIREVMRVNKLLVGDGPGAEAWKEKAIIRAEEIASKPENIARIMRSAKGHQTLMYAKTDDVWQDNLAQLIPPEGISVDELHRRATATFGSRSHFESFKERLARLPGIGHIMLPGQSKRDAQGGYVIRRHVFPEDWVDKAACNTIDPAFFSPLEDLDEIPKILRLVEMAKSICQECPVLLPCLQRAIAADKKHAVRGGVWFENRETELPQKTADAVLQLIGVEGSKDIEPVEIPVSPIELSMEKVLPLVPQEGIDAALLHAIMVSSVGEELSYDDFISQMRKFSMREFSEIGMLETSAEHDGEQSEIFILKKSSFPKEWLERATCRDMDPEGFHPISNPQYVKPAAWQQIEGVKQICRNCPVRLPCLKSAIDAKETDAIRGGIWFANNKELTHEIRNTVQRMVHIQTRH